MTFKRIKVSKSYGMLHHVHDNFLFTKFGGKSQMICIAYRQRDILLCKTYFGLNISQNLVTYIPVCFSSSCEKLHAS